MPFQGSDQYSCLCLPYTYCLIVCSRCQPLPVLRPADAGDTTHVPFERSHWASSVCFPHTHGLILCSRCQPLSIRGAGDTFYRTVVPTQVALQRKTRRKPTDFRELLDARSVIRHGRDLLGTACRGKEHGIDRFILRTYVLFLCAINFLGFRVIPSAGDGPSLVE